MYKEGKVCFSPSVHLWLRYVGLQLNVTDNNEGIIAMEFGTNILSPQRISFNLLNVIS